MFYTNILLGLGTEVQKTHSRRHLKHNVRVRFVILPMTSHDFPSVVIQTRP